MTLADAQYEADYALRRVNELQVVVQSYYDYAESKRLREVRRLVELDHQDVFHKLRVCQEELVTALNKVKRLEAATVVPST
jgi:hypothetical protein